MAATLAIECSQRVGSVALQLNDGAIVEESVRPAGYGDDLMAAIARLCAAHSVRPSGVGAIVVDCGPGGFTGLRVGVTTAKLIAECTGAALVGVPGALVAAEGVRDLGQRREVHRTFAVLAVKRRDSTSTGAGTAWCAVLERSTGAWSMRAPCPGGHLLRVADIGMRVVDSGVEAVLAESALLPEVAKTAREAGLAWFEPRWSARACLAVGARRLVLAERDDPAALQPIYAREAEAVSLWDARNLEGPGRA